MGNQSFFTQRTTNILVWTGIWLLGSIWTAAAQDRKAASRKPSADSSKGSKDNGHELDGAWRLVRSLDPVSGQMRDIPPGVEMIKLVVGGRFAWIVSRNGIAIAGAGGTYSQAPKTYSESVSYAVAQNQRPLIGTTTRFTWTLESGRWHHKGTLRAGEAKQEIDEIWERIP